MPVLRYRVVQPWGPDKGGTVQSEHTTVAEAFAAVDSIASEMAQSGVPGDAIELVVVDEHGHVVPRRAPTDVSATALRGQTAGADGNGVAERRTPNRHG